jgi:HAD superfamily hydrolase (TIGR01509 family)
MQKKKNLREEGGGVRDQLNESIENELKTYQIHKPNRIDNVIFDMDGTLTELNLPFDEIRMALGIKEGFILENLMRLDPEEREEKMNILKVFEIDAAKKAKLAPNTKELFEHLSERSIKKGIVTRNCIESAQIFSKKFDLRFDYFVSRESVPPKPSPLPVLKAILLANSRPENSIMVGDFKFDLIAGKLAGVRTILVKTEKNSHLIEEMKKYADHIVDDLLQIDRLIQPIH